MSARDAEASAPAGADIHNHLMAGVDDGAADLGQARSALEAFAESGVSLVVTTPHVLGWLTLNPDALGRRLAELDAAWAELDALAAREFPAMTVLRGAEVMLDVPEPLLDDERLRLAGGPYVLVEFPYMSVPPRAVNALSNIRMQGWQPVLAHPERYIGLDAGLAAAGEWRHVGACLQVNAGSITGRYGEDARRASIGLLERGWVDLLASDHHARGGLGLRSARNWLLDRGGEEQAELLLDTNPSRIANGDEPLPVPPLPERRGLLARIVDVFR